MKTKKEQREREKEREREREGGREGGEIEWKRKKQKQEEKKFFLIYVSLFLNFSTLSRNKSFPSFWSLNQYKPAVLHL